MTEFLHILIYSSLGIVLMLLGNVLVDLVVPCHFAEEIKKQNVAVGYLMAGTSVGIGVIIRAAVMSPAASAAYETLFAGVVSTVYYSIIGIVFCMLGYLVMILINRKFDLNKEIGNGNPAAGLMVAGLFIGLAIIISGVIL